MSTTFCTSLTALPSSIHCFTRAIRAMGPRTEASSPPSRLTVEPRLLKARLMPDTEALALDAPAAPVRSISLHAFFMASDMDMPCLRYSAAMVAACAFKDFTACTGWAVLILASMTILPSAIGYTSNPMFFRKSSSAFVRREAFWNSSGFSRRNSCSYFSSFCPFAFLLRMLTTWANTPSPMQ